MDPSPLSFWQDEAAILDWMRPWTNLHSFQFEPPVHIRWFEGATLNVAANCLDRHLERRKDQTALIWEPNDPTEPHRTVSYGELHREVGRFANGLRALGAGKGDRITIYMPLVPEAVVAMLACARIGAIHSVVFAGFSAESLASRILDCDSRFVITADSFYRGEKQVFLKKNVDEALARCPKVEKVVMLSRSPCTHDWDPSRDVRYDELLRSQSHDCPPEEMSSEDGLFILYTSGSTGKPKGVYHTSGGYLVYAAHTFKHVFDHQEGDVFWCTADIGWITGHSYVVYGPLANGATVLIHEGIPNHPTPARVWEIVDKHRVSIFYTAPTAIRALEREGSSWVKKTSRESLRVLGSVGEPINPEAWRWYYEVVGEHRCPIVDTWWQTETGGILISPIAGVTPLKPGSATKPYRGVVPVLMDAQNQPIEGPGEGALCLARSWPGQMRTVFGDHARFEETYFRQYPGYYFTGDGCKRDEDGYYWITGRIDDVLNISGHRIGTAEVESALVLHDDVVEAAVVGFPHDIKGQGIYAFVTLANDATERPELNDELRALVRKEIGAFASPEKIQIAQALPKTRSGKIMRRILRKIAEGQLRELGDTSTLADPSVVTALVDRRIP